MRASRLGRSTIIELAPTRQGAVARLAKGAIDRVVGLGLLVLASPFLALAMLAIFTIVKGGAMYEASVAGQKFSYKPKDAAE